MLDGTDDALWPFWSPDSRAIAFFVRVVLKRWILKVDVYKRVNLFVVQEGGLER